MALPVWDNSGPNRFDYAINALPFLGLTSKQYPYLRESLTSRKEQIDTTANPGEQSLQGWWYRSQSSFDFGAGARYFDTATGDTLARRFADSHGVNVFTEGEVTLLRETTRVDLTGDAVLDAGSHEAIGYANAGEEGVLVYTNSTLRKVTAAGAISTVTWGGTGTILALATDGGAYYVADSTGVWRGLLPGGTGTKIYNFPAGITRALLAFAKQRLLIVGNQYAWAGASIPPTIPTTLDTLPEAEVTATGHLGYFAAASFSDWTWTAIAEGPQAIYGAGYAGDLSYIYAVTLEVTGKNEPVFSAPYVAAELPRGEYVTSMLGYLGTYLVVGTNYGVRVGAIESSANLRMGPLTIESDADVLALMAQGNFVYASGSNSDGKIGLYRIDLSQPVDQSGRFAWARDLYLEGSTFSEATPIQSIVPIGYTQRLAFTVKNVGLAYEAVSQRVASGWLETGKIRFDTAEDKIFQYIRVNNLSTDGGISIAWRNEVGVLTTQYTYETDNIRTVDTDASDGEPHPWASYRFTLTRGNASTSSSPVLLNYQLKAQPSNVKQRTIRLALMCYQREQGADKRVIERPVWSRIQTLEASERKGSVVRFQDLNTGEDTLCIIEKVQFLAETAPETRSAQANPGGVLIVTLRTVV